MPALNVLHMIKHLYSYFFQVKAENKDLGRLLLKYPWILSSSIQKNYMEIHYFFDTKMVLKIASLFEHEYESTSSYVKLELSIVIFFKDK